MYVLALAKKEKKKKEKKKCPVPKPEQISDNQFSHQKKVPIRRLPGITKQTRNWGSDTVSFSYVALVFSRYGRFGNAGSSYPGD